MTEEQYKKTTNPVATYGESSPSVLKFQQDLNLKNKGMTGYTPLKEDSKYGPLTKAAAGFKAPTATPTLPPRVTPKTDTVAPVPEDPNKKINPMAQEDEMYKTLLNRSSDLIKATTQNYEDQLQQRRKGTAGALATAGLGGSSAGYAAQAEETKPILDAREKDLQKVYSDIRTTAHEYTKENQAQAKDSIAALAKNHLDWAKYKETNPENYKSLVQSVGGDPNVADAMFAMSIPAPEIASTWTTSDGQGGSVVWQQRTDPLTGNPSIVKFDMPGVPIPQNWTSDKLGTNAQIFKSPAFNPTDPSTYMIVSTDPTNGGAITVTQNGKTTVNGVPVNNTPGSSSVVGAGPQVASLIGLQDPSTPLDAVLADPSIGLDGIVAGIIQNEGGSPKGVVNNPGNIKFVGGAGQTDSGIKATDGGTFASYATPQAGKQAIASLVNKGAASGKTFEDFINAYTGTSGGPSSTNQSILSHAGISLQVFNYLTQGTASMSRMSAAQRNKIMTEATDFLNKHGLDVSTFQSQYKTYNDVLSSNISRNAKTKIMENELEGTVDNLLSTVSDADLGKVNVKNIADIWAGKQVNDPVATRYAFHFEQLKNELAGYFAASQGKTSPDVVDNNDAANAVINGMSTGSLTGFKKAVQDSTNKMSGILQKSVDDARKNVWTLFGVGDKYKSAGDAKKPETPTDFSDIQSSITLDSKTHTAYIPRAIWSTLGSRMDALLAEAKADGYDLKVKD